MRHSIMRAGFGAVAGLAAMVVASGEPAWAEADVVLQPDGTTQVTIDARTCRAYGNAVTYHQPPGVEYEPGVDVNGKAVAPADLNGGYGVDLPREITIPITIDLGGPWRDRIAAGTVKGETMLGAVTVRDGQVFWNGRAMEPQAQAEVWEACRRLGVLQDAAKERKPKPE